MMLWDEAKRYARRKSFYRKLLHKYGILYPDTIGIKVDELIKILREI